MREKESKTDDINEFCTDITPEESVRLSAAELRVRHKRYLQAATSENTRKTYRSAVRHFERWGGYLPTDKDIVIRYLLEHADSLNPRTLEVRLTALSQWHQFQEFDDPCSNPEVRKTLKGIRRTHGQPKRKAKALRLEELAVMLNWLNAQPDSNKKLRDLALIQIGFFGAFRRSELVNIKVEHLKWESEGLVINLPKSKTDQEGGGLFRAIPKTNTIVCPVTALSNWLHKTGIDSGFIFRPINRWDHIKDKSLNPGAINELLKSLAWACGFDFAAELSSHSFRRGLSTSAAREDVSFEYIKKQGGWVSDTTVWEYIDEGRRFENNATLPLLLKIETLLSST